MKVDRDAVTFPVAELAALGRDGIHDLWRRLHRKPPPRGLTGDLLVRTLAWRLQCVREGELTRGTDQHLARAARAAARNLARFAKASSAGPAGKAAEMAKGKGGMGKGEGAAASSSVRRLRPGTRLLREWQGTVHEVTVSTDGFFWNGGTHRSLSVIARAITGTSWNGWLFFGLTGKREKHAGSGAAPAPAPAPVEQLLKPPSTAIEAGLNSAAPRSGADAAARGSTRTSGRDRDGGPAHG